MRKWIRYAAAFALFLLLPGSGKELSHLRPAGVLRVDMENRKIALSTDLGDRGEGETLDAAITDLRSSSTGEVFLDTVQYLLVSAEAEVLAKELAEVLRPSVRYCVIQGSPDLPETKAYLDAHKLEQKLEHWQESHLILKWNEDNFHLEEKESK